MIPICPDKAKGLARLQKIEGQIRGIERMVQEDQPCLDILTQLTSVKSALKALSLILIENELQYYLIEWTGPDREEQEAAVNAVIEQVKILEVPSQN